MGDFAAGAMGTTVDTPCLGSGDGSRDFAAGERRQHWRFTSREVETTLET